MLVETRETKTHWLAVGVLVIGLAVTGLFFREEVPAQPTATAPTATELSKLFRLLQIHRFKDYKIIYNGYPYDIEKALGRVRMLLLYHYDGEGARAWIESRLYRSPDQGKIIYAAFPDGSRQPLRDVLAEELDRLFPS